MKRRIRIIWDDEAKQSLRSIYEYIRSRESVRVATNVRAEIIKQIKTINQFPEKSAEEPILKNEIGNFVIK